MTRKRSAFQAYDERGEMKAETSTQAASSGLKDSDAAATRTAGSGQSGAMDASPNTMIPGV